MTKFNIILILALALFASAGVFGQAAARVDEKVMAARVKAEFLHAWNGYKKFAWGHDDLQPLSKKPKDWYGQTLLMTPVDSLDTLILMGFKAEADETRRYITKNLSFDKDISVHRATARCPGAPRPRRRSRRCAP